MGFHRGRAPSRALHCKKNYNKRSKFGRLSHSGTKDLSHLSAGSSEFVNKWVLPQTLEIAIVHFYCKQLNCVPEQFWDIDGGAIDVIKQSFNVPGSGPLIRGFQIRKILHKVNRSIMSKNMNFVIIRNDKKRYKRKKLQVTSTDVQMIADMIESGISERMTTAIINSERRKKGASPMSRSTLRRVLVNLEPLRRSCVKIPQGDKDKDSKWAIARKNWALQLAIRFRSIQWREVDPIKPPPPEFDLNALGVLHLEQIAYWDEVHPKCHKCDILDGKKEVLFPRNEDGTLNPLDGEYKTASVNFDAKFKEEARLLAGVAMCANLDGSIQTKRLPMFSYSGKIVVGVKKYERMIKQQITLDKLKVNDPPTKWLIGSNKTEFHANSKLTHLPHLSDYYKSKLRKMYNVQTLADLHQMDLSKCHTEKFKDRILMAIEATKDFVSVEAPRTYLTEDNPYKALYKESWREEIKKGSIMSKVVCVTELIDFMFYHTKKCFQGTLYEKKFYFYHDALAQMCEKEAREYMSQKGILSHWVLPMNDLNKDTFWDGRPTGNSPEFNPLDRNLFRDLHCAVRQQVAVTSTLPRGDPKKYSLGSIKDLEKVYEHTWIHYPSHDRICRDFNRVPQVLRVIYEHDGTAVRGIGQRPGRRHIKQIKDKFIRRKTVVKRPEEANLVLLQQSQDVLHRSVERSVDCVKKKLGFDEIGQLDGSASLQHGEVMSILG